MASALEERARLDKRRRDQLGQPGEAVQEAQANRADTRLVSILFLALQLGWLVYAKGSVSTMVAAGIATVIVGTAIFRDRWLHRSYQGISLAILSFVFAGWTIVGHWHLPKTMREIYALVAQLMIIVQATELIRWPVRRPTANYVPGLGCFTMMLIFLCYDGDFTLRQEAWFSFSFMAILYFVLRPDLLRMLVALSGHDWQKAATVISVAAVSLSTGYLLQSDLETHIENLQRSIPGLTAIRGQSRFGLAEANFVTNVDLDSVTDAQKQNPNAPVFTAECDTSPGYMRTLAFTEFDGWRWIAGPRRAREGARAIRALRSVPTVLQERAGRHPGRCFELQDTEPPYREMIVSLPTGVGKLSPLPLNAAVVQSESSYLSVDPHGVVVFGLRTVEEYVVYDGAGHRSQLRPAYRTRLLSVPANGATEFRTLSESICGEQRSPRAIGKAITRYFQQNHGYSLDYEPAGDGRGLSRILDFLRNREAAHCEYFATATVMLMRAQGIPCRLATGYLCYELNDSEDYFIARNRNAHAWAEAYDEASEQWFIVEATPGVQEYVYQYRSIDLSGTEPVAANSAAGNSSGTWGTFVGLSAGVVSFATQIWPFVLLALAGIWGLQRWRRSRSVVAHPAAHLLRRADRQAARLGIARETHETCHQFSQRLAAKGINALADWYRRYANSRYRQSDLFTEAPPKA